MDEIDISKPPPDPTRRHYGALLFFGAALFCVLVKAFAKENREDWLTPVSYVVVVACGAIAGSWETHLRWAGAIGGVIAGIGAVAALEWMAEFRIVGGAIVLGALLIGMSPGFIVYFLLREITRIAKREPRPLVDDPPWMVDAAGRRRRLLIIAIVFAALLGGVAFFASFHPPQP